MCITRQLNGRMVGASKNRTKWQTVVVVGEETVNNCMGKMSLSFFIFKYAVMFPRRG